MRRRPHIEGSHLIAKWYMCTDIMELQTEFCVVLLTCKGCSRALENVYDRYASYCSRNHYACCSGRAWCAVLCDEAPTHRETGEWNGMYTLTTCSEQKLNATAEVEEKSRATGAVEWGMHTTSYMIQVVKSETIRFVFEEWQFNKADCFNTYPPS